MEEVGRGDFVSFGHVAEGEEDISGRATIIDALDLQPSERDSVLGRKLNLLALLPTGLKKRVEGYQHGALCRRRRNRPPPPATTRAGSARIRRCESCAILTSPTPARNPLRPSFRTVCNNFAPLKRSRRATSRNRLAPGPSRSASGRAALEAPTRRVKSDRLQPRRWAKAQSARRRPISARFRF